MYATKAWVTCIASVAVLQRIRVEDPPVGNEKLDANSAIRSRILQTDPSRIMLLACDQVSELLNGENACLFETEHVRHSIEIAASADSPATLWRLDFIADGVIQSLLNGDHPHTPTLPLSDLLPDLAGCQEITSAEVLSAYKKRALSSSPRCYPCDTDFVGIITSRLIMINGIRLHQSVDFEISNGYIETSQEFGEIGCSSWDSCIDLLRIKEFLEAHNGSSYAGLETRPEFNGINALRIEDNEVSANDIASSYSQGAAYGYSIDNLVLMIEEERESLEAAISGTMCVDLLAGSSEAAEAVMAINDLVH